MSKTTIQQQARFVNWEQIQPQLEKMLSDHEERIERKIKYATMPESLSLTKAGDILGKSYPTIKRMIKEGELKTDWHGRVTKDSILRWLGKVEKL